MFLAASFDNILAGADHIEGAPAGGSVSVSISDQTCLLLDLFAALASDYMLLNLLLKNMEAARVEEGSVVMKRIRGCGWDAYSILSWRVQVCCENVCRRLRTMEVLMRVSTWLLA